MKRQTLIYWLFNIALILMSSVAFGQGTVKGILMDSIENEPMLGAEIRINDKEGNFVTGGSSDVMEGAYQISVAAGTYDLSCSYMGYSTYKKEITIKDGQTLELNINMSEEVNVLKIVTKTASRFETSVGKSSISIDVIQPDLVDNTNATKVDEVVDKVPGVSVVDGQANIRGGSGFSYGAGSRVLLLVDDLPLLSGDAGQPNWRDIPVENISQIEVVKGAASAVYGSSALNGIINIRTAYAKNKPFTKVSVFQTSFLDPKRPVTAWWKRDSIEVWDAADNDPNDADTLSPQLLSGRNGYRKPIELGVQFAHRRKIGKYDLTLGGNYFYQDSYRAGAYERKFRITANNRYRFSTKVNAGVNLNFNYGQSSSFFLWNNTGKFLFGSGSNNADHIYEPLAGTITESTIMRFNVDPFLTAYDNKDGRHRLQTRYYHVSNQNGQNQSNLSHLFYGEYQYQRKFKVESSFFGDFKLVAGAVGTYTFSRSQLFGNADYKVYNAGAYIQGEQGFIKEKNSENTKLNLTFGVRWEVFNIVSPDSVQIDPRNAQLVENPEPNSIDKSGVPRPRFRVGLNYELTPFTFIRASWGEGYRYPTIAERYIATQVGSGVGSSLAILANPELKPESGWSAEIGIKQGFKIGNWKGFIDLSGFWTEYQDMMEFTFGGGDPTATNAANIFFQSINVDDTRIRGFEFSLMGTGNIGPVSFNVLAGYTFIAPEFQNWDTDTIIQTLSSTDYNILKYRNVHNVKFDIEAFFLKDKALSVGFSLNYNSSMENIDKAFEDIIYNVPGDDDIFGIGYYRENFNSGEFTNVSARIGYRYAFKNKDDNEIAAVKLSLVGKNLLNQEYMIRPALVDAPANITVRLDVEF